MTLSWTCPMCEACWIDKRGDWQLVPGVGEVLHGVPVPTRVVRDAEELERCAFCGKPTFVGIYVRQDPTTVPYPATKDDPDG